MAKKWGRVSLPRLLRETEEKQKRNYLVLSFAVIAAVIVIVSVVILFAPKFAPAPEPAYGFKTDVNHPKAISDLIKNGTVVLFFSSNNESWCQPCKHMAPKVAALQSQYKNVTFVRFNFDDNSTSYTIMENYYKTDLVPTVVVIRGDGAVAKFVGDTDISPIKSAIEDAQNWQQSHPT
jgi:thiol-disulfide isomerase/thioredoxin